MLIYKPSKEVFNNRKEIKQKYGIRKYRQMIKDNEIIFLNGKVAIDDETIYCNNERNTFF